MSMGVDRELLSQCQLDDRLILSASEEREDATEDRDRESRCRHIEVRFWPSRRHEGRLNLVSERPYPWWTTAITHGGNTSRIKAAEF
jgi:hypothetical protein